MQNEWIMFVIWAIVIVISVSIELNTYALIGWASALAAIVALIIHTIFRGNIVWPEITAYFIVWGGAWISFFFLFPRKRLHDKNDGFYEYIGKTVVVTKSNKDEEFGEIKLGDKFFRFKDEIVYEKGTKTVLVKIKGVTAQIRREV